MKKFLLTLFLSLCFSYAAAAPDLQSQMAEEAEKNGVTLVRNDSYAPLEIRMEQIGKPLLCLSLDFKTAGLTVITRRFFRNGAQTILVRCVDGRLLYARGYI